MGAASSAPARACARGVIYNPRRSFSDMLEVADFVEFLTNYNLELEP